MKETCDMQISFSVLRFELQLARPLRVPLDKYVNVVRGALGLNLPKDLLSPPSRHPSGLTSPPKPFIIRVQPAHAGLTLTIHLFGPPSQLVPAFTAAVQEIAAAGLGPGRVPAGISASETTRIELPLSPATSAPPRVTIHFLTPTELKHGGELTPQVPFPALFHRLRDRILFFAAPNQDHSELARQLAARAAAIHQIDEQLTHIKTERTSTRTGQTHPIGGFLGHATYAGDFHVLWPWLLAAQWTGVGRQTTWGKGHIRCEPVPA
jgi:hypothetical protein